MRTDVDISAYSSKHPNRIKPEKVNLGNLPPIAKPKVQKDIATQSSEQSSEVTELRSSKVTKSVSPELPKLQSSKITDLQTYEVKNYKKLKRLEIRVTRDQRRFLDDWEDLIRDKMPEGERNNPDSKRITKASIIRAFVEIFRQLNLQIDPKNFRNEIDLMNEIYAELKDKVTKSVSSEVTKSQSSDVR